MTLYWTSGNRNDAILALVVAAFTIIELRYGFWKRITNRIGDFFGRPLPTRYVLALPFVIWFWLTLLLFVHYDENILLVRAFNLGQEVGTGHVFVWFILAAIFTRWGYNNLVGGFTIVGMFGALHEIVWYAFYAVVYQSEVSGTYLFYLPFMVLGLSLTVSYVVLSRNGSIPTVDKRTLLTIAIFFIVLDSMWAVGGFPVTVDLAHGNTPLFYNLTVNLVENYSWVVPAIPLIIAKPRTITRPIRWLQRWAKK